MADATDHDHTTVRKVELVHEGELDRAIALVHEMHLAELADALASIDTSDGPPANRHGLGSSTLL